MKKRKGNSMDLIGTAICLLALLTVFISFVHFSVLIEFKRNLNAVTRDYLLLVETNGYLTNEELNQFSTDIQKYMPSTEGTVSINVCYYGNEVKNSPAQYGDPIAVEAKVTANYKALGLTKIYSFIKDNYEFTSFYESTSKQ